MPLNKTLNPTNPQRPLITFLLLPTLHPPTTSTFLLSSHYPTITSAFTPQRRPPPIHPPTTFPLHLFLPPTALNSHHFLLIFPSPIHRLFLPRHLFFLFDFPTDTILPPLHPVFFYPHHLISLSSHHFILPFPMSTHHRHRSFLSSFRYSILLLLLLFCIVLSPSSYHFTQLFLSFFPVPTYLSHYPPSSFYSLLAGLKIRD